MAERQIGPASHVQFFLHAFLSSNDIPVLLLNQPNVLFKMAAKLTWLEVLRAMTQPKGNMLWFFVQKLSTLLQVSLSGNILKNCPFLMCR